MKTCSDAGQSCQFEPRYDECYHPCLSLIKMSEASKLLKDNKVEEFKKIFYYKEYVHDICVKCGRVVKRVNDGKR